MFLALHKGVGKDRIHLTKDAYASAGEVSSGKIDEVHIIHAHLSFF